MRLCLKFALTIFFYTVPLSPSLTISFKETIPMQLNVMNVDFWESEQNDEAMMHVSVDAQRDEGWDEGIR